MQQETRLDISHLEATVQLYCEQGLAETTRNTYKAGIKRFKEFCMSYSIVTPLPVSQHLVCLFVGYLASIGLSHSTIKTYLSALRHLQIINDFGDPMWATMPKLKLVERGIRRMGVSSNSTKRLRLPVTPSILRQVKALWASRATEFETILHWAVCCTAFFGFFRLGELLEGTASSSSAAMADDIAVDDI